MPVFLETERLTLRQFEQEDADDLYQLDSDPEVLRYIGSDELAPSDYATVREWTLPRMFAYYEAHESLGFWAAEERQSGEFVGWFCLRPAEDGPAKGLVEGPGEVELGYRLKRAAWGMGYATEGSKALVSKGFEELEVQRVIAVAQAANSSSRRVLEKAGLKEVGHFVGRDSGREEVGYALDRHRFLVAADTVEG